MGVWQQELEFVHRVADAYPPIAGRAMVMCRRGKRAGARSVLLAFDEPVEGRNPTRPRTPVT